MGEKFMNCREVMLIKVYEYDGKNIKGSVHDVVKNVSMSFLNMTQLLLNIEQLIDLHENCKLCKNEIFKSAIIHSAYKSEPEGFNAAERKKRILRTFKLDILFRRFGTWQGILSCVDSGKRCSFRSIIEMCIMMDDELERILTPRLSDAL